MNNIKTQVMLVDIKDRVIGLKEKFVAHKIPVSLHRAISIIIYNKDKTQMLITKRSIKKPVWPHFWTNAVCSHPYPNESYQDAADRRIYEELGFKTKLKEVFRFIYKANMDNGVWGEHEFDAVFIGKYQSDIHPNKEEVDGFEWIKIDDLKRDLKKNSQKYTPWFKIILKKLDIV